MFVWSLSTAQLVSWGILFYSIAVFVVPMEADLGWSKTALNAGITIGLVASGVFAPWAGTQIDRGNAWVVMTAGSIVGSLAVAAWAFVATPLVFWLLWVVIGFAMSCTLYEPGFAVLSRTMGDQAPRAILKMTLVGGLASTAFIPLAHLLVQELGWRHAVLSLAVINLAISASIHALMLRPDRLPPAPPRSQKLPSVSTRAALADLRFWGLLIAFSIYNLVFTTFIFHFLPILEERGVSRDTGVALFTLIGPLQVSGRILLFAGGQMVSARLVGRAVFITAVPLLILAALAGADLALLTLFVAIYGVINGISTVVRGTIVRELFGAQSYGAISGSLTLPSNFARAVGPAFGAVLWSIGGGYGLVLYTLAGLCSVGAIAYWTATRDMGSS
ncbi:MAG: MFS transporter [Alphaproteobacteria bacterium]|nr:MFS transporter [Alphaproteobacteria bacterium]